MRRGDPQFPLQKVWRSMHYRCGSRGNSPHKNYVGVRVDERWATWEGFLANQPAGRAWEEGLHLCRTGDVGDYSPENTRWDTAEANLRERWPRKEPSTTKPLSAGVVRETLEILTRANAKLSTTTSQNPPESV